MRKLIIKVRLFVTLILFVVTVFSLAFIYFPIKKEYKKAALQNFMLSAQLMLNGYESNVPIMEGIELSLIDEDSAMRIISSYRKYKLMENVDLVKEGEYVSYINFVPNAGLYLYARIKKNVLFKPIRKLSLLCLAAFIIGMSVLSSTICFVMVRNVRKVVSNLEKTKEKYKEYANKDALTGTYSRLFFQNWLSQEADVAIEDVDSISALIMIDLDGFKKVNDKYGHLVGDEVLGEIADILKSCIREDDFVIRYGGDEFLILLKNSDIESCNDIISRIEAKFKALSQYEVQMSYGIEEVKDKSRLLEHIRNADQKMYQMKRQKYKQLQSGT